MNNTDRRYRVNLPSKSNTLPESDLQQYLFTKEARKSATIPLKELEKKYIELILKQNRFNMSESARILNISRKALYDKINRYGIHFTRHFKNWFMKRIVQSKSRKQNQTTQLLIEAALQLIRNRLRQEQRTFVELFAGTETLPWPY